MHYLAFSPTAYPGLMDIREESVLAASTREDRQQVVLDAIAELEQQHADGTMETPAYLLKKRALIKRL